METCATAGNLFGVYNYDSFRRELIKQDMHFSGGPAPGTDAPDFDLQTISGRLFRLGTLRGIRPALLVFGSITCPMTAGARPGLVRLFAEWKDQLELVSVYVREAHPGERYPHHTSDDKRCATRANGLSRIASLGR